MAVAAVLRVSAHDPSPASQSSLVRRLRRVLPELVSLGGWFDAGDGIAVWADARSATVFCAAADMMNDIAPGSYGHSVEMSDDLDVVLPALIAAIEDDRGTIARAGIESAFDETGRPWWAWGGECLCVLTISLAEDGWLQWTFTAPARGIGGRWVIGEVPPGEFDSCDSAWTEFLDDPRQRARTLLRAVRRMTGRNLRI